VRTPTPRRVRTTFGTGTPVIAIGLPRRPLADVYHLLLTWSWTRLFAVLGASYVLAIAAFALAYLALGDGAIDGARLESFEDAFFFSFQTMATIGYGHMVPKSTAANLVSVVQVMIGLAGTALSTGLFFAKFARPTARVLFSEVAVVTRFDGVPSLLFRMANARGNQIAEAQLKVVVLRDERTAEGESIRRAHDLVLRRDRSLAFSLSWLAIHPIEASSPLRGATAASLAAEDAVVMASVSGLDEHLGQTVHARHAWPAAKIRFGHRFVDVLGEAPDGTAEIDYRKFHDVAPEPGAEPARAAAEGATARLP
jgi:inward rectifier potassium channel